MAMPVILLSILASVIGDNSPEQIHLSLSRDPNAMTVMWTTQQKSSESIVLYGEHEMSMRVFAVQTPFVDGGEEQRVIYMHEATLRDLQPNSTYGNLWRRRHENQICRQIGQLA
ncbi:unnamed protein product [Hydatigera taeniaeformis]|uniref:Pur_ac_phosph_N domain-containing protein n=1 Tax=Hydatigena taeniaeformis TaxID=6205 RepID=A0A0R3XBX0_HYDTA|nr:unnamed protein product [Hydatigera taeniaeformis]